MRIRNSPRPTGLLISLILIALYTLPTQAQSELPTLASSASNNNALPGTDRPSSSSSAPDSSSSSSAPASATPNSSSGSRSASSSSAAPSSTGPTSSTPAPTVPALTTSTTSSDALPGVPTGLPKLSGIVSYPPASVPPTKNAPYMQQSNMPEGTVFIAVGACLGAIGMAILAWRGYIAWSLHRSVKRAALHQTLTEKTFRPPPGATGNAGQFYSAQAGSTLSIDALTSGKRASTAQKSHTPNGSLFFSPTANVGASGNLSNRGSAYLPSGYYPSGSGTPGENRSSVMLGRGPAAQGYIRQSSVGGIGPGPSPPGSPALQSSSHGHAPVGVSHHPSQNSLSVAPQGRAPSAYLEDLFAGRDGRK